MRQSPQATRRRTPQANDKQQFIPNLAALSPAIGQVGKALVDTGYYSAAAVLTTEAGDTNSRSRSRS